MNMWSMWLGVEQIGSLPSNSKNAGCNLSLGREIVSWNMIREKKNWIKSQYQHLTKATPIVAEVEWNLGNSTSNLKDYNWVSHACRLPSPD